MLAIVEEVVGDFVGCLATNLGPTCSEIIDLFFKDISRKLSTRDSKLNPGQAA